MKELLLFTGGYTEPILMGSGEVVQGKGKGIACYCFDENTGRLERRSVTEEISNPSYILADSEGPYLYCVNELKSYQGLEGSTISAFVFDPETGRLRLLNRQFTGSADACHLRFSPDRKYLLVTNYSGGSFGVFPILEDHSLGTATCILKHQGKGTNPDRQEGPHPHQTLLSPDGRFVYVSDLGLDRLICYEADWQKGWLLPAGERDISGFPGQGVRHGIFHPSGRYLYVMTELSCEINVYQYDITGGRAEYLQTISAFGKDDSPDDSCLGSAIHLHPNGRWLYCGVRGSNHIGVFEIGEAGKLRLLETHPSGGQIPREFTLSPNGKYLLAGNQDTDNICVFEIHPETGCLREISEEEKAYCVTTLAFWAEN